MASRFLVFCCMYFQVANSQYYTLPATSYNYSPAYSYSYYPPALPPANAYAGVAAKPPLKTPKRSVASPSCPICSPSTASAYFLTTPTEQVKATVLSSEKNQEKSVPYNCPLCNNFADVPPNSKILPPPKGLPVLPGIFDEIPTIVIPKDLAITDLGLLKKEVPLNSDSYEKRKLLKNLRFDQDLLEGFLTGLGIA